MNSICLSCILYTCENAQVAENQYIQVFVMWLTQIVKINALKSNDILHITIDQPTYDYMQSHYTSFKSLMNKINHIIFIASSPKTNLEGWMWKFIPHDYSQDVYLYLDIDIFILKPLIQLVQHMKANQIYACSEGSMTNSNYNAAFPESVREQFTMKEPGYSVGKFAITSRKMRDLFFKEINRICDNTVNYYCPEQAFYNVVIYSMRNTLILNTIVLCAPYISLNGYLYRKDKTVLFDCAGEPGNGLKHIEKYIDVLGLLATDKL
jgi:hypothetical protein